MPVRKKRPIYTRVGRIKPLGKSRIVKKAKPRPWRPFKITSYRLKERLPRVEGLVIHRRPSGRPDIALDPRELRAVSLLKVRGTLPERIFYKSLRQRRLSPDRDFDFQSSLLGGRLQLGGIVADFLFPLWRLIVRIQGPTHTTRVQSLKDLQQVQLLVDMGWTVYDLPVEIVYDIMALETWMRRHIDQHPSLGGQQVIGQTVFLATGQMNFAWTAQEHTRVAVLEDAVENLIRDMGRIEGRAVVTINGLSDIDTNLGLVQAGEFRVGNKKHPGGGFTGVRIGWPAFVYGSEEWHIVGVNNDVLQFGLRATDGKAVFGAGEVILDSDGITLATPTDEPNIGTANTITFVDANEVMYTEIASWKNDVGSELEGVFKTLHLQSATKATTRLIAGTDINGSPQYANFRLVSDDTPAETYASLDCPLFIEEQAAAGADQETFGQLWVKDTTPCELWFTDDAGTDTRLGGFRLVDAGAFPEAGNWFSQSQLDLASVYTSADYHPSHTIVAGGNFIDGNTGTEANCSEPDVGDIPSSIFLFDMGEIVGISEVRVLQQDHITDYATEIYIYVSETGAFGGEEVLVASITSGVSKVAYNYIDFTTYGIGPTAGRYWGIRGYRSGATTNYWRVLECNFKWYPSLVFANVPWGTTIKAYNSGDSLVEEHTQNNFFYSESVQFTDQTIDRIRIYDAESVLFHDTGASWSWTLGDVWVFWNLS